MTPAAFGGALASTLLVFGLARAGGERAPGPRRACCSPASSSPPAGARVIALLLTLAPDAQVGHAVLADRRPVGGAARRRPRSSRWPSRSPSRSPFARDLNVLARGEDVAARAGVAVPRATLALHALAALATAVAVTTAGSVGFVGLVVPHALRLVIGNDQRVLLPAAALAGGTLLVARRHAGAHASSRRSSCRSA